MPYGCCVKHMYTSDALIGNLYQNGQCIVIHVHGGYYKLNTYSKYLEHFVFYRFFFSSLAQVGDVIRTGQGGSALRGAGGHVSGRLHHSPLGYTSTYSTWAPLDHEWLCIAPEVSTSQMMAIDIASLEHRPRSPLIKRVRESG